MGDERELTYGEKIAGINFNPSNDPLVQGTKEQFAALIDSLANQREAATSGEVKRMLSVAITDLQSAQMFAVKAITWQFN